MKLKALLKEFKASLKEFKASLKNLKDSLKNLKDSLKNLKDSLKEFKASLTEFKDSPWRMGFAAIQTKATDPGFQVPESVQTDFVYVAAISIHQVYLFAKVRFFHTSVYAWLKALDISHLSSLLPT
ncbi:hypothetical protein NSTCB13_04962 [Nostoc sp. DSM 114160]|jgi:Sec-independent protein translocase protein TatA